MPDPQRWRELANAITLRYGSPTKEVNIYLTPPMRGGMLLSDQAVHSNHKWVRMATSKHCGHTRVSPDPFFSYEAALRS